MVGALIDTMKRTEILRILKSKNYGNAIYQQRQKN